MYCRSSYLRYNQYKHCGFVSIFLQLDWSEVTQTSGNILSVLDKLFLFVDKNYDKSCTLSDAAAFLKYDYTYLSKLFKCKTGMSYNEYVNHFRIGRATYLLFDKDRSISEVAFEVGYNSIRTFNWEFQKIMHATPVAYRSGLPQ